MDSLRDIIITSLGTIITVGTGVIVAYFKHIHRKLDKLETDKKDKETQIQHLHNGFRDEVKNEIIEVKQEIKLIKQYLIKENK